MRDNKTCSLVTLAVYILGLALLASGVWAQATPRPKWSTYHFDSLRAGQNPDSQDIANPSSIGLVWVFPRDTATHVDELTSIVDDTQDPTLFTPDPTWRSGAHNDAYATRYFQKNAISRDKAASATTVEWKLPDIGFGQGQLPPGTYQIAVWVPPLTDSNNVETNTTQAEYEVWDDNGVTTIRFNQQNAAYWKPLSTRYFSFTGKGANKGFLGVRLTNCTYDEPEAIDNAAADGRPITVCADAIKFIPATGQEIYSSPASGELYWSADDPENPGTKLWDGLTPFVFVGTVEAPLVYSDNPADTGAIYAINSVTPTVVALSDISDITDPEEHRRMEELSKHLGTVLWRYPNEDPSARDEIEGPIEGGVFSSPTLGYVQRSATSERELVCYVAAMDRQVYAINAQTGKLMWKGPGVTVGDGTATKSGTWNEVLDRPDAFGGKFSWADCEDASAAAGKIEWKFPANVREAAGQPGGGSGGSTAGWAYAVYAWIPVRSGADKPRIHDATYTIYYYDNGGNRTKAEVTVDQASLQNQGKWVKLGSSYFNVDAVELSKGTRAHESKEAQDAGLTSPSDFSVVADAVMIVPETIGAFSYSTVVKDDRLINGSVYAANGAGRIVAFDAAGPLSSNNAITKWIYPAVRSTVAPSATDPGDAESLGEIGSSPVYTNDRLFIATYDAEGGQVISLNTNTNPPTQDWVFPNETDAQNGEFPAGFTSSPAVDISGGFSSGQLFIGSTDGTFYCLHTSARSSGSQLKWKYPDDNNTLPPGAFRYSTPAIAVDGHGVRRAWVGGSDGRVYSFLATNTATGSRRLGTDDDSVLWYAEPSVMSPIQASVALDGNRPLMFVGDMRGRLSWFDATTGGVVHDGDPNTKDTYRGWLTEGELFSSPNITTVEVSTKQASWIYEGCSDGRLYAFSHAGGAWGGEWSGGEWPFEGSPDGEQQRIDTLAPNTEVQFDIFPNTFYQRCADFNPEPKKGDVYLATEADPSNPDTWPDEWIVGEEMKLVDGSKFEVENSNRSRDDEIDEELRKLALLRRGLQFLDKPGDVMGKNKRTTDSGTVSASEGLYFEWGEQINMVIWNLPGLEYLYGTDSTSKRNNIRFTFTNASAGDNAGTQITMSGDRKILKEYTVLDKSRPRREEVGGVTVNGYEPLKYDLGDEVKRCYVLAQIDIKGNSSRPPSPGAGWILSAEIKRKESTKTDAPVIPQIIPLARLTFEHVKGFKTISDPDKKVAVPKLRPLKEGLKDEEGVIKVQGEWDYTQQPLGINNPLAINVGGVTKIAWGNGQTPNRYDVEAHYNGNPPGMTRHNAPVLDMSTVPHGSSSPERVFGVMDRSAVGCNLTGGDRKSPTPPSQQTISKFRIGADDLRWRGYLDSVEVPSSITGISYGKRLPWEQGPGSVDYPNIYKQHQSYRKLWDDADPSKDFTTLPPLMLKWDNALGEWNTNYPDDPSNASASSPSPVLRPDSVYISVNVPRFQPANVARDPQYRSGGYSRTMQAYIDSDGDRNWDSGTSIFNRPSTYQEAYREFRVGISVPPDPRLEVEEQHIDIGRAPHGLGEAMPWAFNPFNNTPEVQQWFKTLTIKNAGNVNLTNLNIGRTGTDRNGNTWTVDLFSDQASPSAILPGYYIVSSLDGIAPSGMSYPFVSHPFTTSVSGEPSLGYTLTKPRVGDPDPTILTIPDRRKWDSNYGNTRNLFAEIMDPANSSLPMEYKWNPDAPLPVKVSVQVPLTQPVGTYGSWNPLTKQPLSIPVFSDLKQNGSYPSLDFGEPFSDPSFQLSVSVRENQLTGGVTPTTLPQIDIPNGDPLPLFGDASPAAFRDNKDGHVFLFWSSNRNYKNDLIPTPGNAKDFASAPWFLSRAALIWGGDTDGWTIASDGSKWWETADAATDPILPDFQWPDDSQLLVTDAGASVMEWKVDNSPTGMKSVRHYSPVIAENLERIAKEPDSDANLQWLAWVGTADISTASGKIVQEHRIFYTDATHGNVSDDGSGSRKVYTIEHDPTMVKRYPSLAVFGSAMGNNNENMWMFWQGGESSRWSIYYSINKNAPKFESAHWTDDMKLRTPDCLSTVSSPNAVLRNLWRPGNYTFDVVYSGVSKITQNPDVLLTRYVAEDNSRNAFSPSRRAAPMPRTFSEKLERDSKFGFFTSRHIAWLRPGKGDFDKVLAARLNSSGGVRPNWDNLLIDHIGRNEHVAFQNALDSWFASNGLPMNVPVLYDMPYIRVVLPQDYHTFADGSTVKAGTIVSATDGSIYEPSDNGMVELVPPAPIIPEIDDATGVYTYKYPDPRTREILGEMLVDYSAGIVRFTQPLPERKDQATGVVSAPKVYADYTPQTWRLTTDTAADTSPRSFIERTIMTTQNNPGLGGTDKGVPNVDRLWTFWRKAVPGSDSSTIYYSTHRIGVDLSQLRDADGNPYPAIPMNNDGSPGGSFTISNYLGPWEVDRTGKKIYFTQVEERYSSLVRSGALSSPPNPIEISYEVNNTTYEITLRDISWIEELPEQALFGYAADGAVNEGSIYAFADPDPKARGRNGTFQPLNSSKIWVFWTSTRSGTSDLFWETLSPDFAAR